MVLVIAAIRANPYRAIVLPRSGVGVGMGGLPAHTGLACKRADVTRASDTNPQVPLMLTTEV